MLLEGYNLVMMAAETGDLEMLQRNLKSESIDQCNNNGNCALILAVKNQRFQATELLLKHKANVNARNNAGQSALALACWQGWEEGVCVLIHYGADVNLSDKGGWSPLIIAAHKNYLNIVNILLGHGADTKHRNNYGKRAVDKTDCQDIVMALSESEIEDKGLNKLGVNRNKTNRQEGICDYYDEIWEGVAKHPLADNTPDFITRNHPKPNKLINCKEDLTLENEYSLNNQSYSHKPPTNIKPKQLSKLNKSNAKMRRVSSAHTLKPPLPLQNPSPKLNKVSSSFLTPQSRSIPNVNLIKSPKNVSFTNTSVSSKASSVVPKPTLKHSKGGVYDYKAKIILHLDKQISHQSKALMSNTVDKVNNELTLQISKLEKIFNSKIEESLVGMNETIASSFSDIYKIVMNDVSYITSADFNEKQQETVQDIRKDDTQVEYEKPIKIPIPITQTKSLQKTDTENDKEKPQKRRIPQNNQNHTLKTQGMSKKIPIPHESPVQLQKLNTDKDWEMPKKLPIPKPIPQITHKPHTKKEYEIPIKLDIPEDLSRIYKFTNTDKRYDLPQIIENPPELAHLSQESDTEIEQQPETSEKPREVPKPYTIVPKLDLSFI